MSYTTITVTHNAAITRITLNRPEAANGVNEIMTRELAEAASHCDTPDTKVVVLSASGRFFCAGGDLKAFAAGPDGPGRHVAQMADPLHRAISTFAQMDPILVTAVNGAAAGAGFSLAIIGDLVLAAESASFTMAYTKAGLSPDGSSSYYLPRLIGLRRAQELMLTNRRLSAGQAAAWVLATKVVAYEDLSHRTDALAADLAAGSRSSAAAVKTLLHSSYGRGLDEQTAAEAHLIAAFPDKRTPRFA